ncbi:MAG: hypothetical protein ABEJ55_03090, partial [Halanaeroarchaeum sp.]
IQDVEKPVVGGVAGVKVQGDVAAVTVTDTKIVDLHSPGWVWGVVLAGSDSAEGSPANVTIQENAIGGLNDGSRYDIDEGRDGMPYPGSAVGIDAGATAAAATVRYNSLLAPNGAESKDEETALDARCNWWGAKTGPTWEVDAEGEGTLALERGDATIEAEPWLVTPAPSRACKGTEE